MSSSAHKEEKMARGILDMFTLSEIQRLKGQNVKLRMSLIQRELENLPVRQRQLLDDQKKAQSEWDKLMAEIGEDRAIDMSKYRVNLDSGECKKIDIVPKP